jgi:hypothetical protein
MAHFNYTKSKGTARGLLQKFGQSMTLRRTATTGSDPWNPGSGATTDYDTIGASMSYALRHVDGSMVQRNDKRILLYSEEAPALTDTLVFGGVTHTIINVQPLSPGGVTVYYEVQARA